MRDDDLMLAADWSELPLDLLGLITDKLKSTFSLLEYIRFGAVCFEWRRSFFSIQIYDDHIKLPSNLPLLLIPTLSSSHEDYNDEDDYNNDPDNNQGDEHEHDDYPDNNQGDEEQEHDDYYDNNHGDDEDEQEILQDDFDDNNHGEEGLEMPYNNYYYYYDDEDEQKPREHYYKRKGIWKGQDAETRHKTTRSFYSLSQGKVYQDFQLPVPYYKNCRGSSHGWLITVDEEEEEQPDGTYTYPVRLLNPFRSVNNEIQLPPLTPISELDEEPGDSYYLIKAYLSANPSSLSNPADLLVLAVYGCNRFGFCRPGDTAWTHLPLESKVGEVIEDLICYKGRFLAVFQEGSVLELEFAHDHLPEPSGVTFVAGSPTDVDKRKYLVESNGDLLQVQRHIYQEEGDDYYETIGFRVFKLNDAAAAAATSNEWVEMDNLDGRMLFLGDNSSISLSATDFPGLLSNCIYFTDDYYEYHHADPGPRDFGIFNLVDKSVVSNFDDKNFDRLYATHKHIMPPPIWIQPML